MRWMLAILTATMFLPGALATDAAWTARPERHQRLVGARLTEFYVPLASRNHPHNGPLMCIGPRGPGAMKQDPRGPTMMHCTASTQNITIMIFNGRNLERHSWPASAHVVCKAK